jgi:hypothetical protein
MDLTAIGRTVFIAGLIVAAVGAGLWAAGRFGLPLGRLPGDVRWDFGGGSVYIPIATSIVLSLVLTIVLNLVFRLFNR